MITRALISVSNKEGIVEFAKALAAKHIEIVSTGGTAKALEEAGVAVRAIDDLTGFPEMLDGRVKTLHPLVHGGLLGLRDNPEHQAQMKEHNIEPIDLVVVNLYPFEATVKRGAEFDEVVENIDIGGPSMVRSAAKNYQSVSVVVDPADYAVVLEELEANGQTAPETRKRLMQKAFSHTAFYDSMIADYMNGQQPGGKQFTNELTFGYKKVADMRYGENPHQPAAFYQEPFCNETSIAEAKILQGKQLSYNNIMDADAALRMVKEFEQPAAVIVKHANPAGIAIADDITVAFTKAYEADALSAFGGIVALNRTCTKAIADYLDGVFAEIVLAPDFEPAALEVFAKKKNLRILELGDIVLEDKLWETRKVVGGVLVQEVNKAEVTADRLVVATKDAPTEDQMKDLLFAWKVVKHVKSNAIVIAKHGVTLGIGAGQMSRIDSVNIAISKAGDQIPGAVLASDAFFPFEDSIETVAPLGISAVIQPGGSVNDPKVVDAANHANVAMVLTGERAFYH